MFPEPNRNDFNRDQQHQHPLPSQQTPFNTLSSTSQYPPIWSQPPVQQQYFQGTVPIREQRMSPSPHPLPSLIQQPQRSSSFALPMIPHQTHRSFSNNWLLNPLHPQAPPPQPQPQDAYAYQSYPFGQHPPPSFPTHYYQKPPLNNPDYMVQQPHFDAHSQNDHQMRNSLPTINRRATQNDIRPVPLYAIATVNNANLKKSRSNEETSTIAKKGFKNSRRRHRNSHLGCATCKSRRIKCDEQLRACRNCIRAHLSCAYLTLDDAALDALRSAQKAHATRVEKLISQEAIRESSREIICNPSPVEGGPEIPPQLNRYPFYSTGNLHINVQRPSFPMYIPDRKESYQYPQAAPELLHPEVGRLFQLPDIHSKDTFSSANDASRPLPSSSSSFESSDSGGALSSKTSESSTSTGSVTECIEKDITLLTLRAIMADTTQYPGQMNVDDDNVKVVLHPDCVRQLNMYWTDYDRVSDGFDREELYAEYDWKNEILFKEAANNVVLFKSLLTHGSVILNHFTENKEAKEYTRHRIDQDFGVTLSFLNKFKINSSSDVSDLGSFYNNMTLLFSISQIYDVCFYSAFYGPLTLKENVQFANKLFHFYIDYLNNGFKVFSDPAIIEKYKSNVVFQKVNMYHNHLCSFIRFNAQSVQFYHIRPYRHTFLRELHTKFKETKPIIYDQLENLNKKQYDKLEDYLMRILEYLEEALEHNAPTNRLQIIFYTIRKLLSIFPCEAHIAAKSDDFSIQLLFGYYHAVVAALSAIFAEGRFYFIVSYNGPDGIRGAHSVLRLHASTEITEEQRNMLDYPVRIIQFFRKRNELFSQYFAGISSFPVDSILDDQNNSKLMNLIQEDQMDSFSSDVPESAYPQIDRDSEFFDAKSNSIVIPSDPNTKGFANFETSQMNKLEDVTQALNQPLSTIDRKLIHSYFEDEET